MILWPAIVGIIALALDVPTGFIELSVEDMALASGQPAVGLETPFHRLDGALLAPQSMGFRWREVAAASALANQPTLACLTRVDEVIVWKVMPRAGAVKRAGMWCVVVTVMMSVVRQAGLGMQAKADRQRGAKEGECGVVSHRYAPCEGCAAKHPRERQSGA
jgi:hypothetical protein